MTDFAANAPAGISTGPVVRFQEFLARRRTFAKTVAELQALTDRELNDIGISRCDIAAVARRSTS